MIMSSKNNNKLDITSTASACKYGMSRCVDTSPPAELATRTSKTTFTASARSGAASAAASALAAAAAAAASSASAAATA